MANVKGISGIQWSLKDFEIGKALGKGKFGYTMASTGTRLIVVLRNVYMAREKASKTVVALKVIL